jgi:hypothetical protein
VAPAPPEAELAVVDKPGSPAVPLLLALLQAASATDTAAMLTAIAERVPLRLLVMVIA